MIHPIVVNRRGKTVRGFRYRETIGIAIVNPRGVKQGSKTTIIGM